MSDDKKLNEYDIHGHVAMRHQEFMDKHKLGTNKSAAIRKIKGPKHLDDDKKISNPDYKTSRVYHKGVEHSKQINTEVRDKLHKGYSEMAKSHHEELKHHLLHTYIKGNTKHSLPYVKVHGQGGYDHESDTHKPVHAHATDPSDNEMYHKIRNAHHLSFHKSGQGNITVKTHEHEHDEHGKKAMSLQVKHSNGPLTNVSVLAGH